MPHGIQTRMISHYESSQTLRTGTGQSGLPPRGLPHHDQEKYTRDGNYIHCVVQNADCTIQAFFRWNTISISASSPRPSWSCWVCYERPWVIGLYLKLFIPGKGWNVILRLYGPLEPWCEKTWRPGEIELVKWHDGVPDKSVKEGW